MEFEKLIAGKYYHIYNRGNNRNNLFSIPADYEHFLRLYEKYISPVAETLAWGLMPNHIHLLVRIKENVVYKYSPDIPVHDKLIDTVGWEKWFEEHKWETTDLSAFATFKRRQVFDADGLSVADLSAFVEPDNVKVEKKPVPHRHFSHLFNAYTRYYHNRTGGCGNLFERPFKRNEVDNQSYLKQLILYIHNNPVHHGFCKHPLEYSWSSYITCISDKPTKLKREAVTNLFENIDNSKKEHTKQIEIEPIEKWLNLDADYFTDLSNQTDLSAYEVPDNVKRSIPDNVKLNYNNQLNADRSGDAVWLTKKQL